MRRGSWVVIGTVAALAGSAGPAVAAEPYEGLWAGTARACRAQDGVDRMEITGARFFWYETRCTARDVRAAGPGAWTMRMSCEGEGSRFTARPRVMLPRPDRLVMEDGPVGRAKRQEYVRCGRR